MRTRLVLLGCLGIAAASLLLPSAPTTDPWGWIVWGREVAHLRLDTVVGGAPSWKPLPVLVTAPLALAGTAAPALWLVFARAAGLASVVMAHRVARRIGGHELAGVAAAAALVASEGWLRAVAHGYSEPLVAALVLGALDRHLDGRRGQAFALATAATLCRPELWPALVAYAAVALVGAGRARALATAAGVVPALWVVPDWIGSGTLLHGSRVARAVSTTGPHAAAEAIRHGLLIGGPVVPLLAAATTAHALRSRDRRLLTVAAAGWGWMAALALLMLVGYPPSGRYFFEPAALLCVVAGAGVATLPRTLGGRRVSIAAAGMLVAATLTWVALRGPVLVEGGEAAAARAQLQEGLRAAADAVPRAVLRSTRVALPRGLGWSKGALAWELRRRPASIVEVRSSAGAYVRLLQSPAADEAPPRPAAARVSVLPRGSRLLLFEPFGAAPVRVAGGWRERPVDASGRWRVLLLIRRA